MVEDSRHKETCLLILDDLLVFLAFDMALDKEERKRCSTAQADSVVGVKH